MHKFTEVASIYPLDGATTCKLIPVPVKERSKPKTKKYKFKSIKQVN